ncbi:uncharacterized protein ACIBXB_022314 [Morphnus guianensis]
MRTIAKSTLGSRCEPGSGRVEGVRFRAGSGLSVKGAGIAHVLNDCVWAPQEGVEDAPSPSFSSSSIQVPKILNTLYSYMQQSTHRPFLLHAVFLLTHFHQEPVISSLLQKSLFMDSDTVELWRSLGRSILGIRILRCLVEKLNRAGNDRPGTDSSTCERHDRQTALETLTLILGRKGVRCPLRVPMEIRRALCWAGLKERGEPGQFGWWVKAFPEQVVLGHVSPQITCAISEVVLALRSTEELSWGELYLECQMHVEKPCRVFLSALELVLGKCMAQKWMQLLVNWGVWARLEDPLAHPEGVCLLSR